MAGRKGQHDIPVARVRSSYISGKSSVKPSVICALPPRTILRVIGIIQNQYVNLMRVMNADDIAMISMFSAVNVRHMTSLAVCEKYTVSARHI